MWILLSGNLLNIIGNYVLIYGKLGFPEMGLLGAGYSTLFSRVFMLLPILMLYQFVDGAQIVLANALRGLSDVKPIMWISFITNFLIAIPAGYLLGFPLGMGISGIWLAYPIGFVFSVTLLGLRARKTMNP